MGGREEGRDREEAREEGRCECTHVHVHNQVGSVTKKECVN